jgi:hypothetical protein
LVKTFVVESFPTIALVNFFFVESFPQRQWLKFVLWGTSRNAIGRNSCCGKLPAASLVKIFVVESFPQRHWLNFVLWETSRNVIGRNFFCGKLPPSFWPRHPLCYSCTAAWEGQETKDISFHYPLIFVFPA